MKLVLILVTLLSTYSAFAYWNEVECEGKVDQKVIRVEVEQPFPNGSFYKRALLSITEDGAEKEFSYTVFSRISPRSNRINYSASGLDLDIDFWPDQLPRWGRTYRATLRSSEIKNQYIRGLNCRFPNAK